MMESNRHLSPRKPEDEKRRRRKLLLTIAGVGVGVFLLGLLVGLGIGRVLGGDGLLPAREDELAGTATALAASARVDPATSTPEVIAEATADVVAPLTSTPTPTAPAATPTSTPVPSWYEGPIEYGESVLGRPLLAYRYGNGPQKRAIIGAIHGGYEWNTVEVISRTMEVLDDDHSLVPENITLYLIPNMNPDGYAAGTDAEVGRMNANGIDLNRNWDYEWQEWATHGTRPVRAGRGGPFSEPETAATRDFILDNDIELVIFYHSAMGVVFSGAERERCATFELAEMLAEVTGYRHQTEGIPGQITTGDAIDYLSDIGIAGAEIELTTHEHVSDEEFERNLEGIIAFMNWTIPASGEDAEASGTPQTSIATGEEITHTVKAGEGLWSIALKYDIELGSDRYEELLRINEITDEDSITVGTVLVIPPPEQEE